MRNVEPVIEESRNVEDVHHLRLMSLLHELVREKGNRSVVSAFGHRSKDGGRVHADRKPEVTDA